MDIDDLTDDDRQQLAKDLAAELDTGLYGNRAVLSRRQLLSLAGGSAGVAGLMALGVDPATAQSAAGQVGTESSPEDVFAYNLDVQNGATFNGNDLTGVGSLSTNGPPKGSTIEPVSGSGSDNAGYAYHTQATDGVSTSGTAILSHDDGGATPISGLLVVYGDEQGNNSQFTDWVSIFRAGTSVTVQFSETIGSPATRSYEWVADDIELTMTSDTYDVVAGGFMIQRNLN